MFIAIEQEIGTEKMWEWLKNILNTNTVFTNYDFLLSTLHKTVNNEKTILKIVDNYFNSEISLENIIYQLKRK
jgi:hypothetical protein